MGIKFNPITGNLDFTGSTSGLVSSVTASAPLTSTGGTTPDISITGLTNQQLLFGNGSGGISQSSDLSWDDGNDTFNLTGSLFINGLQTSGTNTGDVTIGSANGLSLSGQVLSMDVADAGVTGTVTAATQSFSGLKSFNNGINLPNSTLNGVFYQSLSGVENNSNLKYDENNKVFSAHFSNPQAVGNFGTVLLNVEVQANLTATYEFVGSGGYSYASGTNNPTYEVLAAKTIDGVEMYASNAISVGAAESTDLDVTGAGGIITYGSGSYTAANQTYDYQIYTIYDGSSASSPSPPAFTSAQADNSGNPFYVDLTWTAPTGSTSSFSYYLILNTTTNTYNTTTDIFIVDDGNWTGGSPGIPAVGLSTWDLATNSNATADAWYFRNQTTTAYTSSGSVFITDDNTWGTSGSLPSSPTSLERASLDSYGTTRIASGGGSYKLGFFGTTPVALQSGNILSALGNYGLIDNPTIPSTGITGLNATQILFGSNVGDIGQSSSFVWDTSNSRLGVSITPTAKLHVAGTNAATIIEIIRGSVSQSANLTTWQNSAAGTLAQMTSNGSLGLGVTVAPVSRLHIDSGSSTASDLRFTAGTTTGQTSSDGLQIGITSTGIAEIRQRENLALNFYTNNTLTTEMTSANTVGIGTAGTVGAMLQINASAAGTIGQILKGTTSQSANLFDFRNSSNTTIASFTKDAMFIPAANSTTVAPIQFTSGSLLTSPIVGGYEFLTDKFYGTITTGTARKEFTLNDVSLTSGRIPIATTNGRLTDNADLTFVTDTLTATKIVATGSFNSGVVALTDAATIATDVSLGNTFTVTIAGNRTLGAPTNPVSGQKVTWQIRQDGTGSRTLAFNAIFRFGNSLSSITLSTTANKTDYIGAIYNSTDSKWDIVSFSDGY